MLKLAAVYAVKGKVKIFAPELCGYVVLCPLPVAGICELLELPVILYYFVTKYGLIFTSLNKDVF